MQQRKYILIGIILAAIGIAAAIFLRSKPTTEVVTSERIRKEIYNFDPQVCPGETVKLKMDDPYLRGLIEEGTEVDAVLNYYTCNELKRGDVVLYRFSEFDSPVFRRVVAVGGDTFDLTEVGEGGGWELVVNGKKVRGVKGETYSFGGAEPPPLKLAVEQNGGRIGKDVAILFSAFPPGDRDSGVFGIISTTDIIGKATTGSEK